MSIATLPISSVKMFASASRLHCSRLISSRRSRTSSGRLQCTLPTSSRKCRTQQQPSAALLTHNYIEKRPLSLSPALLTANLVAEIQVMPDRCILAKTFELFKTVLRPRVVSLAGLPLDCEGRQRRAVACLAGERFPTVQSLKVCASASRAPCLRLISPLRFRSMLSDAS